MTDKLKTKAEKALAKSWRHRTLPTILHAQEPLDKLSKRHLIQADENKLVLKYTGASSTLIGIGVLNIFFSLIFIFGEGEYQYPQYIAWGFGVIGILLLLYNFTMPKKYWVFNRRTQMVTVPGRHYTKGHDIPLDQMRIKTWMTTSNAGVTRVFPVAKVPSSRFEEALGINIASLEMLQSFNDLYKLWSYYVWYMDENRPLPPGKIFDHCRDREFLDRKKRGFPLPKYYSLVATPEANPTFQKERNRYWTDEMFNPDVNKYGECCLEPGKAKLPEGSVEYSPKYNPENWERVEFEDPSGFKYAPAIHWIRYAFEDGRLVFTLNYPLGLSRTALIPPKGSKYKTDYFRLPYMDVYPYFQKELEELRAKEGQSKA